MTLPADREQAEHRQPIYLPHTTAYLRRGACKNESDNALQSNIWKCREVRFRAHSSLTESGPSISTVRRVPSRQHELPQNDSVYHLLPAFAVANIRSVAAYLESRLERLEP